MGTVHERHLANGYGPDVWTTRPARYADYMEPSSDGWYVSDDWPALDLGSQPPEPRTPALGLWRAPKDYQFWNDSARRMDLVDRLVRRVRGMPADRAKFILAEARNAVLRESDTCAVLERFLA